MTETELVKDQIAKVLTRAYPPVIMTLDDIAAFVGMSYGFVKDELQNQPGFPKKLDRFNKPRWSRDAIMEWAQVSA